MKNAAHVDMTHPLVQYACSANVMRRGRGCEEQYVIDGAGGVRLREAILFHEHDLNPKTLAQALLGLWAIAAWLFEEANAPDAARHMFRVLCEVSPRLPIVDQSGRLKKKMRRFKAMLGETGDPKISPAAPAPAGALKLSSMDGFKSDRVRAGQPRRRRR